MPVTDDFSGYRACFNLGITEAGCMAHARRKFHEFWANHSSSVGKQALKCLATFYDVERKVQRLQTRKRQAVRQARSRPLADTLRQWLVQQRKAVPDGSATATDCSLNPWTALTRYIDDSDLPIDQNRVDNQIRPIALLEGRTGLFVGGLRAG